MEWQRVVRAFVALLAAAPPLTVTLAPRERQGASAAAAAAVAAAAGAGAGADAAGPGAWRAAQEGKEWRQAMAAEEAEQEAWQAQWDVSRVQLV